MRAHNERNIRTTLAKGGISILAQNVLDEHAGLRNMRRYNDALLARDWDTLADALAAEHRFEDRRLGMKVTLDKAGNIQQAQVMADLAEGREISVDLELIEVRGERLALVRQVYRDSDYAIPLLVVIEVDEDGRTPVFIIFDEDDMDAARSQLEAMVGPEG